MKDCIQSYIGSRYGLNFSVKEPKEMVYETKDRDIKVDKWQIAITIAPGRVDIPKQKIKIEVCNIPSYTRTPQALKANYGFLPDGYTEVLIMTESLREIMADKLISLVNTTRYVRHRDIWDLRWLKQRGAQIDKKMILSKLNDYKINDYLQKLENLMGGIDEIIHSKPFWDELLRFIPLSVQETTLKKAKFKDFLINETKLFQF
jgi:hypothetical protein